MTAPTKTLKEHPILFSGEMVKAILDNRKTMTRRIIKLPKCEFPYVYYGAKTGEYLFGEPNYPEEGSFAIDCPYGQVGDRLWVRETFSVRETPKEFIVEYKAGGLMVCPSVYAKWKPSIFMPRWACRIILENVSVRVERVQDITEAEALREGILFKSPPISSGGGYRRTFEAGWDEMYSKKPELQWEVNPWVWRVEFERVTS